MAVPTIKLARGVMPLIGYGTFLSKKGLRSLLRCIDGKQGSLRQP